MFNYVIFLDDCVRICFHHWNRHSVFIYGLIGAIHYLNTYSSVFVKCEINWMQTAGMPISIFIGGRASPIDQIVQIFKYVIWSARFKSVLQFLFHFMCLVWSCIKSNSIEIGLYISNGISFWKSKKNVLSFDHSIPQNMHIQWNAPNIEKLNERFYREHDSGFVQMQRVQLCMENCSKTLMYL